MPNQLVKDIMLPFNMVRVSISDEAATASKLVIEENRSAVVEVANDEPLAILSRSSSRRLLDRPGSLGDYKHELTFTAITEADYPVERLVEAVSFETHIDAFIVMDHALRAGVVSVGAIFDQLRAMGRSAAAPVSPSEDFCYCCPFGPVGPAHKVAYNDANRDPFTLLPKCPHHGDQLIPKEPCGGC